MLAPILLSALVGSAAPPIDVRCSAAAAAIVQAFPKTSLPLALDHGVNPAQVKLFVGQVSDQLTRKYSQQAYQKDGSVGWASFGAKHDPVGVEPPHRQTVDAFLKSQVDDAASKCRGLAQLTLKFGWIKPFHFRRRKNIAGLYPYTTVLISLPTIGPNNDEAIIWVDEVSGPLAGSSRLLLLRLNSVKKWQVSGWFPISVS